MVLDRALADAEIRGDVLAELAGEDQFHDLTLSPCQTGQTIGRVLPPRKHRVDLQVFFAQQGLGLGKRLTELPLGRRTAVTHAPAGRVRARGRERGQIRCSMESAHDVSLFAAYRPESSRS